MGEVEHYPDGTFCWVDLGTDDAPAAKRFYGGLLGWEFDDLPAGEKGTYSICRLKGKAVAGLYDQAEEPGWGSYVKVEDVDRAAGRAQELGAEVLVEPFDAPGGEVRTLLQGRRRVGFASRIGITQRAPSGSRAVAPGTCGAPR